MVTTILHIGTAMKIEILNQLGGLKSKEFSFWAGASILNNQKRRLRSIMTPKQFLGHLTKTPIH